MDNVRPFREVPKGMSTSTSPTFCLVCEKEHEMENCPGLTDAKDAAAVSWAWMQFCAENHEREPTLMDAFLAGWRRRTDV